MKLPEPRSCDGCTMCCKLLGVEFPNFIKPRGQWCANCKIGVGCSIYEKRPEPCQVFRCMWVDGIGVEELKPSRCKAVFMLSPFDEKQIQVDIDKDHKWIGSRVDRAINSFLDMGYNIAIVQGESRLFITGKGRTPPEGMVNEDGSTVEGVQMRVYKE